ncbi:ATP-binding cassette domain-containing protein [Clostridium sp. SYSU_GA19001]|uniref:ATP-binding cassette domain-containing protein n=1 Tax=Clostridium caldaquaticum TaxID=2940653 RepID=UPI00207702D7|nr:ATP-binding cassette domain-containing protein [Clostridium caldaquaticum]MCM8709982.1 ATP-binding cassette domain-containing protein [Clostridium caldaquaticum]
MKKEVLRLEHVYKDIQGYRVLDDFKLNIFKGEIVSLVGLSGCGKTELGEILGSNYSFDKGRILFDEKPYKIDRKIPTEKLGIFSLYNRNILVPQLSVAENIFIIWKNNYSYISFSKKKVINQTKLLMEEFNLNIKPDKTAEELSIAEQQAVKLIKAYVKQAKLVVANDIASSYTIDEMNMIIHILKKLKRSDISTLWISTDLDEVTKISDRVVVMREGKNVKTVYPQEYNKDFLMDIVVGREFSKTRERHSHTQDTAVLSLKNIHTKYVHGLSLNVNKGEIVGVLDIENKAKRDLEKLLIGEGSRTQGHMYLNDKKYEPKNLQHALRHGVGYVRGDLLEDSIFSKMSILDNIILPVIKKTSRFKFLVNTKIERFVKKECLNIVKTSQSEVNNSPSSVDSTLKHQIVYNRWLLFNPKVLICVEPFVRADVLLKLELTEAYEELAKNEIGMLLFSVNLKDLTLICDRIIILKNGKAAYEIEKRNFKTFAKDKIFI